MDSQPDYNDSVSHSGYGHIPLFWWQVFSQITKFISYSSKYKSIVMVKLRIIFNRKGCIGSGHCMLSDPYNFRWDENVDWKAELVDGKPMGGAHQQDIFVKEIETDQPHLVINAAKTCTPRVIAVFDLDQTPPKRIAP